MNLELIKYLSQLNNVGKAPKQSSQQLAELGMPEPDLDTTPSQERLSIGSVDGFSDTPQDIKDKLRTRRMLEAANSNDTDEVLSLRKQYRDEMDKLNSLVNR